jgi:uracil-DNA glycosylase family 4
MQSSSPDTARSTGPRAVILGPPTVSPISPYLYYKSANAHVHPDLNKAYREFRFRWDGCTNCQLHTTNRRYVHLSGIIPCDVLFIGEAPGYIESSLGEPFVGPAGKLLKERILRLHHQYPFQLLDYALNTRPIAFTNILSCAPWKENSRSHTRTPTGAESLACEPRLEHTIALAAPKKIVLVGRVSERYAPINSLRTTAIQHPAYILRQPPSEQQRLIDKAIRILTVFFQS